MLILLTSPLHVMEGTLDEIQSALLGWTVLLLEKTLKGRALGAFWRMLWCYSCWGFVPLDTGAHLEQCFHLSFPCNLAYTKTSPRPKPTCGKCRQQGFASTLSSGPDWVSGVGAAGGCRCWKAVQGWQQVVRYKMFISASITPFAVSLCNSQLCVLQLA